jgi:hypothetical protein
MKRDQNRSDELIGSHQPDLIKGFQKPQVESYGNMKVPPVGPKPNIVPKATPAPRQSIIVVKGK